MNDYRKQYRLRVGEAEVGFLSFDVWKLPQELNLYEIMVAREHRRLGVGTEAVRFAIELGRKLGADRLTVRAEPYQREQPKETLINWYMKQGFVLIDAPDLLAFDYRCSRGPSL